MVRPSAVGVLHSDWPKVMPDKRCEDDEEEDFLFASEFMLTNMMHIHIFVV